MPRLKAANLARTTLAQAIDATATSFAVVDASRFPDPPFLVSVEDEIMEVGGIDRATNTFSNVTRGVEGTTPASHAAGTVLENRFTAGMYLALADKAQDVDPKFDASTGHKHSGTAGDAPKLPLTSLDTDVATQAELDAHIGDSTAAHGIGDRDCLIWMGVM